MSYPKFPIGTIVRFWPSDYSDTEIEGRISFIEGNDTYTVYAEHLGREFPRWHASALTPAFDFERSETPPPLPAAKFVKADSGKPRLSILWDQGLALASVARVLWFGATKYSRKNWANVPDAERYTDAALRHIAAHVNGEITDPESGEPHLSHAATSLLFVIELQLRGGKS